jgi:hypothetical protein
MKFAKKFNSFFNRITDSDFEIVVQDAENVKAKIM